MSCEDPPDDYCNTITSNPDISGIGVRVAIYVQTILSMTIASYLPYHETAFRDTSRNSYVVSTSLIIASLIQWKNDNLSLFDALIVTMLTTIMTAFVTVNAPYIRTLGLSVNISSFLFTVFWCYWGLQVWANPVSFGLPDGKTPAECNASAKTIFVVFGKNVSIQNSGLRGFAIFVFGIVIIVAISTLWQCIVWSLRYAVRGPGAAKDAAAQRLAKRLHWERTHRRSRKEHVTRFGGLAGMIYMIVTIEQIVARNPDVSSSSELTDWTYSQTIALIMLGQQIMDCLSYVKEEIQYRRKRQAMMNGDVA